MGKINKNVLYILGGGVALFLVVTILSPANAAYRTDVNSTAPARSAAPVRSEAVPATATKAESKTEGKKKMCPAVTPIKCEIGTSLVVLHDANNCESLVCQGKKVEQKAEQKTPAN